MEIVVLQKDELETLLRRVADAAVERLRVDLETGRVRELMNISQICDYLGKHRSTVSRFMTTGMPHEMCGDQPIFRKSDIDLWLKGELWQKQVNQKPENGMTTETSGRRFLS